VQSELSGGEAAVDGGVIIFICGEDTCVGDDKPCSVSCLPQMGDFHFEAVGVFQSPVACGHFCGCCGEVDDSLIGLEVLSDFFMRCNFSFGEFGHEVGHSVVGAFLEEEGLVIEQSGVVGVRRKCQGRGV